jgi:DNA-binding NarL/FixJ family response regulator
MTATVNRPEHLSDLDRRTAAAGIQIAQALPGSPNLVGLIQWHLLKRKGQPEHLEPFLAEIAALPRKTSARAPQVLRLATLTERELQVLDGMAAGKSNRTIGRELYLTENTIKSHALWLFRKLGAKDRAQAVNIGWQQGILGERA